MDYYNSAGEHIAVTYDGGNGEHVDYVVTRDGKHAGRITCYASGICDAMDSARRLFGSFSSTRAAVVFLAA